MDITQRKKISKHIAQYAKWYAVGLLTFIVTPGSTLTYKVINAMFLIGMLLLILGITRILHKLGLGGLFAFSWGRILHVTRKKKHEGESSRFPSTYFEYVEQMKQKEYKVLLPLICGAACVLCSYILSFCLQGIL